MITEAVCSQVPKGMPLPATVQGHHLLKSLSEAVFKAHTAAPGTLLAHFSDNKPIQSHQWKNAAAAQHSSQRLAQRPAFTELTKVSQAAPTCF